MAEGNSTEKKTIILDFEVDAKDATVTIEKLTAANKALREERKKVDVSTEEGQKRIKAINDQIDHNTGTIKANSSALEKQRFEIGNYTGALDKLVPGLGATINGFKAMTKEAWAFVANPIGAVVAALGLALGALMTYFKGSEEGQNRLNIIMGAAGAIMEKITDVVEDLGEAIFNAFTNPKKALTDLYEFIKQNLINRFTAFGVVLEGIINLDFKKIADGVIQAGTGVENATDKVKNLATASSNAISKAIEDGARLAKMENDFEREDRERTETRAKRDLDVSLLRRKADESEGAQKLKYLNEALELEKLSIEQATKSATLARDIAKEKVRINGDDKEALDELSKAEADLFNAQRGAFDETRKMNKERLATEAQIAKAHDDRVNNEKEAIKFSEEFVKGLSKETDAIKEKAKLQEELLTRVSGGAKTSAEAEQKYAKETSVVKVSELKYVDEIQTSFINKQDEGAKKSYQLFKSLNDQKIKDLVKGAQTTVSISAGLIDQITKAQIGAYEVERNALEVSLANQKTAINEAYNQTLEYQKVVNNDMLTEAQQAADDRYKATLDALKLQLSDGAITQEEYDKEELKAKGLHDKDMAQAQKDADQAIVALNETRQAEIKAAEIEQAEALNEIKRKEFEANKKNQIAQALANIADAVLGAFAGTPGGIIIKGIAAAAAAIFGAIQIRQIEKTEFVPTTFRTGGYTGDGNPDELAGLTHKQEFVMPADVVAQYGKEHFQSYMDGSVVANANTAGVGGGANQQKIVVYASWTEFKKFETEMKMKESVTTA